MCPIAKMIGQEKEARSRDIFEIGDVGIGRIRYKVNNIETCLILPLTSSSSIVVLLSVDSLTLEPSLFLLMMLRPVK